MDLLLDCVEASVASFRCLDAVTALVWTARIRDTEADHPGDDESLRLGSDKRFLGLCKKLRELAPEMSGNTLSSVVWSMAKLGFRDEVLLTTIAEKAASNMSIFHHSHLMRVYWGYARVRFRHQKLLEKLPAAALSVVNDLPAMDLSYILWAFAEFDLVKAHHGTFTHILDRLLLLVQQGLVRVRQAEEAAAEPRHRDVLHPSDFVSLVVAMIPHDGNPQQSVASDRLLVLATAFVRQHKSVLEASHLCGLLWAFSKTQRWSEAIELLEMCASCFPKGLSAVSADAFSAAIWALGAMCTSGGANLEPLVSAAGHKIMEHAMWSLKLLQAPAPLMGLVWGLVCSGLDQKLEVMKQAVERLQEMLSACLPERDEPASAPPPGRLCSLLWALAARGLRARPLLVMVGDLLLVHVQQLSWVDLSDVLWAYTLLDVAHPALFSAAAQRVVAEGSQVSGIAFPDLVRIAWSLTGALADETLRASAVRILLPSQTLSGHLCPDADEKLPPWVWNLLLPVLVLQDCLRDGHHSQWLEFCSQRTLGRDLGRRGGRLRKEICRVLPSSGDAKEEAEAILADGGAAQLAGSDVRLPVDVALPLRKLGLDAEAEVHTVFDLEMGRSVPNGVTHLRRKCLVREGWTLCLVPCAAFSSKRNTTPLKELLRRYPQQ